MTDMGRMVLTEEDRARIIAMVCLMLFNGVLIYDFFGLHGLELYLLISGVAAFYEGTDGVEFGQSKRR